MSILSRDNVALLLLFFFFFNDTATTEIYTLSLHDALPISGPGQAALLQPGVQLGQALEAGHGREEAPARGAHLVRSEEHTSELQSRQYLVCRLLLEKKKTRLQKNSYTT